MKIDGTSVIGGELVLDSELDRFIAANATNFSPDMLADLREEFKGEYELYKKKCCAKNRHQKRTEVSSN